MVIFRLVASVLPRPVAVVVTAIVLAAAIVAIWWFWAEPGAPFRYLEV
ncbi:MAG: hypothetical protein R8F63_11065 [Acidimicrobiales bacterium]|nr:hypothetical protein [Acidimicrobiales bacterium]